MPLVETLRNIDLFHDFLHSVLSDQFIRTPTTVLSIKTIGLLIATLVWRHYGGLVVPLPCSEIVTDNFWQFSLSGILKSRKTIFIRYPSSVEILNLSYDQLSLQRKQLTARFNNDIQIFINIVLFKQYMSYLNIKTY